MLFFGTGVKTAYYNFHDRLLTKNIDSQVINFRLHKIQTNCESKNDLLFEIKLNFTFNDILVSKIVLCMFCNHNHLKKNNMKKLLLITVIFLTSTLSYAQKTFFPTKEGTVLVYKSFDKKDKLTNTLRYTIKHVTINGRNMDITYLCESTDPNEKPVFKDEITIHQKGDILYMDMSNFINKAAFKKEGEIPADIQITGNNMEIPMNPKVGVQLPDANVEMALKIGFINMKMSALITNRKVEAIESVTVKAGTFESYKFTSDVKSAAMGFQVNSSSIAWYVKGIGMVKTESYDKKGKLQSHMELVELRE